jgi:hypothetical protein
MRRCDSARGQSTAMVIVMLWVLILFVALVANVGQAVNRRVALQVVADAGAYTGATKMAEGMNYIAYANGTIQDYWALATEAWLANTAAFDTCAGFDAINDLYEGLYQAMNIPIQIIDGFGPFGYGGAIGGGLVHVEAKGVSDENAGDLFPGETINYREYSNPDASAMEEGIILPKRDLFRLVDIEQVPDGTDPNTKYPSLPPLGKGSKTSITQPCLTVCGLVPCVLPESWNFDVWYKKSSTDVKYFVWIAEAPATRVMIFDAFFGPNAMPKMVAAAAARPVGGSIEKGEPRYVAQLVPMKRVMSMGGYIRDPYSTAPGGLRQVTH